MNRYFLILFLAILHIKGFSQYSAKDFALVTTGVTTKYSSLFKSPENIGVLADIFNQLNITTDLKPVKITVSFTDNEGNVDCEVQFDKSRVFKGGSDYQIHNERMNELNTGISLYLQDQIFTALGQYKKAVATKEYTIDRQVLNFESSVTLKKSNGDWAKFFAANSFDSRGFYPHTFFTTFKLKIKGNDYRSDTKNLRMLNTMKFFAIGATTDVGGAKTGDYFVSKFFEIEL